MGANMEVVTVRFVGISFLWVFNAKPVLTSLDLFRLLIFFKYFNTLNTKFLLICSKLDM